MRYKEEDLMTLELNGVSKIVEGQTHIYPTDLTLEKGRLNMLLGPTPSVYRQPVDATRARVFSDPPMNLLPISKTGDRIMFGDGKSAAVMRP